MYQIPSAKPETVYLLEENKGEILRCIGLGNNFREKIPITQKITARIAK